MTMTMSPVRAAGLIIFRILDKSTKPEYLLLQAKEKTKHWTPPKGHVDEDDESEIVTAQRETKEETGLSPTDYQIIEEFQSVLEYKAWGKPKKVTYWPARIISDTKITISDEHVDFVWADLSKALELVSQYKDMQKALNDTESFIRKKFSLKN